MCKKLLKTYSSALLAGLVMLAVPRVHAAPSCPAGATGTQISPGISIFNALTGVSVGGSQVGSCTPLLIQARLSYNPNGCPGAVCVGFSDGRLILEEILANHVATGLYTTNVTPSPANPSPTAGQTIVPLIGPQDGNCIGSILAVDTIQAAYTITAANIAAGSARFRINYDQGTLWLSGFQSNSASGSTENFVNIAPPPTCTMTPPARLCPGSCENVTVTPVGEGPFTINLTGPGVNITSNNASGAITFPNAACAPATGTNSYTATVTDKFGCTTTCSTTVAATPIPTCTITPPATNCAGSTATITATAAGGTAPLFITISKNGAIVAGPTQGTTLSFNTTTPAGGVTDTYTTHITDSSSGSTAGTTCTCDKTTTLTGTAAPTCTITPPATNCAGSTATITATAAGGTAPLFITISKNGVVVAGPTQGTTLSFNTTTPAGGVTDSYSAHITDSSTGSTAGTTCVCDKTTTLTGTAAPTCTITPADTLCAGSAKTITATASGGTAPLFITISKNGAIVAGPTQGTTLSFNTTAPAGGVTDTYSAHITDSSTGSTAGTTCVCDKTTTLTGTPAPTCTITPPATNCAGSTATITATASGGTAPLFITISKNGTIVAGPTQGTTLSFNTTTPAGGVTDTYSAHITDSSTGSTAGTTCVCDKTTTLTGTAAPTCTITPPATNCAGSTGTITATASGGTAPLFITISKNGTIVAGPTQGTTLSFNTTTPAGGVTDTYSAHITDSSTGSTAGTTCVCDKTTTLTGTAAPTCTITPPATNCAGSTATITATAAGGTAPLFITISKNGTIVAGPTQGTTLSFNTTTPAGGVTDTYSAHITDSSTGSAAGSTCVCDKTTTLTGTPAPTCTITPADTLCAGSAKTITATASGGTAPLFITISKNGTVVAGPTQGTTLSFNTTAPAGGVTDTYSAHITDSSTGSTAGTTCVCDKTTTLTGTPAPTCTITPPATNCAGSTATITATASGGTAPLFITISKNGTIVAGPTQGTTLSFNTTTPAGGVTDTYSAHITDSSTGSTAGTTCVCDKTTTLTGTAAPVCSINPISVPPMLVGTCTNITFTASGGTPPLFITIKKDGVVISGPTQTNSVTLNICAPPVGVTNTYTETVTDSSTGSTASTVCICEKTIQISSFGTPRIAIYKQVVCTDANGNCLPFSDDLNSQKSAIGVSTVDALGTVHCSAFCYRITVTNISDPGIEIHNLQVTDVNYPGAVPVDLSACLPNFPLTLGAPGTANASAFCILSRVTLCDDTENIVTANGVGVSAGTIIGNVPTVHDTNDVTIVPFDITCDKEASLDQITWDNSITLLDGTSALVYFRVTVHNNSTLPLVATIDDQTLGCATLTVNLPPNSSVTTNLCSREVSCPGGTNNIVNISAIVDTSANTGTNLCVYAVIPGDGGQPVTDTTRCEATVGCTNLPACRVTGGGRQDDPIVCPADVRYVTHGGQVGAPVGNKVCSIDTSLPNFFLGNPCIHGRWTHVRHEKGGLKGNFHARFYDTLDCACLDTAMDPQTCQYGTMTVVNGVCGDRSTGPLPRKAPANKIAFTGVGDWACPNGRRESRACLFRVDIEDRGEPGNAHALASNGKANRVPDRYRIRIWVLSDSELAQLQGRHAAGDDQWLLNFRNAISACNGIDFRDGGVACNSANQCTSNDSCSEGGPDNITIAFPGGAPVRLPNIDDGGDLLHGNHQIHPSIKDCDPANPTGPGLAKP